MIDTAGRFLLKGSHKASNLTWLEENFEPRHAHGNFQTARTTPLHANNTLPRPLESSLVDRDSKETMDIPLRIQQCVSCLKEAWTSHIYLFTNPPTYNSRLIVRPHSLYCKVKNSILNPGAGPYVTMCDFRNRPPFDGDLGNTGLSIPGPISLLLWPYGIRVLAYLFNGSTANCKQPVMHKVHSI